MNTGNIIITLRKNKGWSQTDLSKQCGVSREMVGKYERGEAVPSIEAAKKIADEGVTIRAIAGWNYFILDKKN